MLIGNTLASSNIIEGTKSSESSDKLEEELSRFLNLLVTQLKNQIRSILWTPTSSPPNSWPSPVSSSRFSPTPTWKSC